MNKKILFCASAASHITNFHLPYIDYLSENGYTVHTAANGNIGYKNIEKEFVLPFSKSIYSFKNIKAIFMLRKIIKEENYSFISTQSTLAGAVGRLALRLTKQKHTAKSIHTAHGYLFNDDKSLKARLSILLEKFLGKHTDCLLVMNAYDYKMASEHSFCSNTVAINGIGIDENRIKMPNPISISKKKNELQLTDKFVFLCVGEFSDRKNQTEIITAFAAAHTKNPNIKLILAGEGNELDSCKELVSSLKLENDVIFLGQVKNISLIYAISDVLLTSSKSEGIPFNVMEAMLCKIPIVASKVKGHTDLIENNATGILYDLSNISMLSDIIYKISADKTFYDKLKSKTGLDDKFLLKNVYIDICKIYDNLLGEC